MRPRPATFRASHLALLLSAILGLASPRAGLGAVSPAHLQERGFPLIQTYVPTPVEAGPQQFDITRDPQGILYIANAAGVLVFDGAWWQRIPVGKSPDTFSIASDARGLVAVGGVDEFGYLAPDAKGSLHFVSLLPLLPPGDRHMGQVMRTLAIRQGFAFLTPDRLLVWDGGRKLTRIATFPLVRPYAQAFAVGGELYVWTRAGGLLQLAGDRLVPVPGGEKLTERLDAILPAPPGERGLLISVRDRGLFRFLDGQAVPFAPEASRWAAVKKLFYSLQLPDGRWALGSITGGVLLLSPDGTVDQVIDSNVGLPDDFVAGMVLDREGSLWLALNAGVAKVEVASPLSILDGRAGLKGSVYDLTRHQGNLWIGTGSGVFTIAPPARTTGASLETPQWGLPVRLQPVPGLPPAAWSLLSAGDDLLVGTAFGIWDLAGGAAHLLPGTDVSTAYTMVRSQSDPDRIWVGMEDRLLSLYRRHGAWALEARVEAIGREIRTMVESDGVLWCGSPWGGLARLELPGVGQPGAVARAAVRWTALDTHINLFRIGKRILAVTDDRVLRLDEPSGKLVPAADLGPLFHSDISQLAEDAQGNLWQNSVPPSVLLASGSVLRSLVEIPARSIERFMADPDGTMWMATESGVYRYASNLHGQASPLPPPHLARLEAAGGALFFGGAAGVRPGAPDLPTDIRHLHLEFGPLSSRAGLRFQTRLDPIDSDWGAVAAEPAAELTRLPPGPYTFRVRTVGPNGEVSPETSWSFSVRHPWYASPWVLLLAVLAGLGAIRAYNQLRSRALRQRAARLEARVAEQTVALRQTVEELRRAHSELEAANAQLEELTLQDELTGVANRRCLQQVLEKEWSRALWHRQPLGLLLVDLDEFKRLNDTRGHQEGDTTLQAVAKLLAKKVRRAGDLVARYGGEEFAILLPATGLTAAIAMAEELRGGIEALGLPHTAVPGGRVTASFGVAAMTPLPNQPLEELIEAADLALYRAKTDGKNRVRAAGEEGEIAAIR